MSRSPSSPPVLHTWGGSDRVQIQRQTAMELLELVKNVRTSIAVAPGHNGHTDDEVRIVGELSVLEAELSDVLLLAKSQAGSLVKAAANDAHLTDLIKGRTDLG